MEEIKNTEVTEVTETKETEVADKETSTSDSEAMAQMRVEMAKMKKALDKASSETASYKKQLRERQSADEIAAQEKAEKEAEREEQLQRLLKENTVTKYEKNFLALGYGEEYSLKAAIAQYDGDTDELFNIQKKVFENMQKSIKAELTKNLPIAPTSNDGEVVVTKEQFDKMGYSERVELFEKHPSLYEKLTK